MEIEDNILLNNVLCDCNVIYAFNYLLNWTMVPTASRYLLSQDIQTYGT